MTRASGGNFGQDTGVTLANKKLYNVLSFAAIKKNIRLNCISDTFYSAVQLIACNSHAHIISKAGSMIGTKLPSPAFRWSGSSYTEP